MPDRRTRPSPAPRGADDPAHDRGATRRLRGAQKGNKNAVKHGLYSAAAPDDISRHLDAAAALSPSDLAAELALARAHLAALLTAKIIDPDHVRLGLSLVTKIALANGRLRPQDTGLVLDHVTATLNQLATDLGLPDTP